MVRWRTHTDTEIESGIREYSHLQTVPRVSEQRSRAVRARWLSAQARKAPVLCALRV